jgi:type IV secretory pathway VirB2 component (pilin)
MAGSVTQPTNQGSELLALPPTVGRRIRSSSVAMGIGQLLAGIVIAAVTVGLAFGQKSLADPLWVINLIGVIPPVLVIGLAFGLFRARRCVSGDQLIMPRARRVRAVLRTFWVATMLTALLVVVALAVGLSVVSKDKSVSANLSLLDGAAFGIPVVTVVVCSLGFLIGRSLLPPPPAVLAKAWATGS